MQLEQSSWDVDLAVTWMTEQCSFHMQVKIDYGDDDYDEVTVDALTMAALWHKKPDPYTAVVLEAIIDGTLYVNFISVLLKFHVDNFIFLTPSHDFHI
jgi:hypothetical protein